MKTLKLILFLIILSTAAYSQTTPWNTYPATSQTRTYNGTQQIRWLYGTNLYSIEDSLTKIRVSMATSFVPYTGAVTDVNLGGKNLYLNELISGSSFFNSNELNMAGSGVNTTVSPYGLETISAANFMQSSFSYNGITVQLTGPPYTVYSQMAFDPATSGWTFSGPFLRSNATPSGSTDLIRLGDLAAYATTASLGAKQDTVTALKARDTTNKAILTQGHVKITDLNVNTVTVGQGGKTYTSQSQSTIVGYQGLLAGTTGFSNTGVGYQVFLATTSSHDNTAVGAFVLTTQTTGGWNTGVGSGALQLLTTSPSNTAVGFNSLHAVTTGSGFNVAVGYQAGLTTTTGNSNLFAGEGAGSTNTTGNSNTYIGTLSGKNATGSNNVFIGGLAGYSETGSSKFRLSTYSGTPGVELNLLKGDFITGQLTVPVIPVTSATPYKFLSRNTSTGNIEVSPINPTDSTIVANTYKLKNDSTASAGYVTHHFFDNNTGLFTQSQLDAKADSSGSDAYIHNQSSVSVAQHGNIYMDTLSQIVVGEYGSGSLRNVNITSGEVDFNDPTGGISGYITTYGLSYFDNSGTNWTATYASGNMEISGNSTTQFDNGVIMNNAPLVINYMTDGSIPYFVGGVVTQDNADFNYNQSTKALLVNGEFDGISAGAYGLYKTSFSIPQPVGDQYLLLGKVINGISVAGTITGKRSNGSGAGLNSAEIAFNIRAMNSGSGTANWTGDWGNTVTEVALVTVTYDDGLGGGPVSWYAIDAVSTTSTQAPFLSAVFKGYAGGASFLWVPAASISTPTPAPSNGVYSIGNRIIVGVSGLLTFPGYAVAGIAHLGSTGALTTGPTNLASASEVTGLLIGANGGTGVANTGKTIALGGNLITSGAFTTTFTLTGNTNVTLPVTGTLATLAGAETLTNKTLTSPVLTTPTLGVAAATTINKVTITAPTTSATLTLVQGSSLITAGAFSTTLTATANTNITLPISGTLDAIQASNDVVTQSAANASIATYTTTAAGSYRVGGYVKIASIATDIIEAQVTWTDENGTSQTDNFAIQGSTSPLLSTTGFYAFPTKDIRVNSGGVITYKVILQTSGGTVSYDAGGTITKLR